MSYSSISYQGDGKTQNQIEVKQGRQHIATLVRSQDGRWQPRVVNWNDNHEYPVMISLGTCPTLSKAKKRLNDHLHGDRP